MNKCRIHNCIVHADPTQGIATSLADRLECHAGFTNEAGVYHPTAIDTEAWQEFLSITEVDPENAELVWGEWREFLVVHQYRAYAEPADPDPPSLEQLAIPASAEKVKLLSDRRKAGLGLWSKCDPRWDMVDKLKRMANRLDNGEKRRHALTV